MGIIALCWALLLVLARSCLLFVFLPCFGSLSHVPERSRSILGASGRSCSLVVVLARLCSFLLAFCRLFTFEIALARSGTLSLDLRRSCPLLLAIARPCSLLLLPGGPFQFSTALARFQALSLASSFACLAACAYAQPYPCALDCAFQRMQVIHKHMMMPERTKEASTWGSKSGVAQWLACWAHNPKVPGSKPGSATSFRRFGVRVFAQKVLTCWVVRLPFCVRSRAAKTVRKQRENPKICDSKPQNILNTHNETLNPTEKARNSGLNPKPQTLNRKP